MPTNDSEILTLGIDINDAPLNQKVESIEEKIASLKEKASSSILPDSKSVNLPGYAEAMQERYSSWEADLKDIIRARKAIDQAGDSVQRADLSAAFQRKVEMAERSIRDMYKSVSIAKDFTKNLSPVFEEGIKGISGQLNTAFRSVAVRIAEEGGKLTDKKLLEKFMASPEYQKIMEPVQHSNPKVFTKNAMASYLQTQMPFAAPQYVRSDVVGHSAVTFRQQPKSFREMVPAQYANIPTQAPKALRKHGSTEGGNLPLTQVEQEKLDKIVRGDKVSENAAVAAGVYGRSEGRLYYNPRATRDMVNSMGGYAFRDVVIGARGESKYGTQDVEDSKNWPSIQKKQGNNRRMDGGLHTIRALSDEFSWHNPGYYEQAPVFNPADAKTPKRYVGQITHSPTESKRSFAEYTLDMMGAGVQINGRNPVKKNDAGQWIAYPSITGPKQRSTRDNTPSISVDDFHTFGLNGSMLMDIVESMPHARKTGHNDFSDNMIYLKHDERFADRFLPEAEREELLKQYTDIFKNGYDVGEGSDKKHYIRTRLSKTHTEFMWDKIVDDLGRYALGMESDASPNAPTSKEIRNAGLELLSNGAGMGEFGDITSFAKAMYNMNLMATDGESLQSLWGTNFGFKGNAETEKRLSEEGLSEARKRWIMETYGTPNKKVVVGRFTKRDKDGNDVIKYMDGANWAFDPSVQQGFQGRSFGGKATYVKMNLAGLKAQNPGQIRENAMTAQKIAEAGANITEEQRQAILTQYGDLLIPGAGIDGGDLLVPWDTDYVEDTSNIKNKALFKDQNGRALTQEELNARRSRDYSRFGIYGKTTYDDAGTSSRWLSKQLTNSAMAAAFQDEEVNSYFEGVLFKEINRLYQDEQYVRDKLFNGDQSVDLTTTESRKAINDHVANMLQRYSEGERLLPTGVSSYGMAAPNPQNVINYMLENAGQELTQQQKDLHLGANDVVSAKSKSGRLSLLRFPATISGNTEANNAWNSNESRSGRRSFGALVRDSFKTLGLDKSGLYFDPASPVLSDMQGMDFDGDKIMQMAISSLFGLEGMSDDDKKEFLPIATKLVELSQNDDIFVSAAEKMGISTEGEGKEAIIKAVRDAQAKRKEALTQSAIPKGSTRKYSIFNPRDAAEWIPMAMQTSPMMGGADRATDLMALLRNNAGRISPEIAQAILDHESQYDVVSTFLKTAQFWANSDEQKAAAGLGRGFMRIFEWANKDVTTKGENEGSTLSWDKDAQERFNKRNFDQINLPTSGSSALLGTLRARMKAKQSGLSINNADQYGHDVFDWGTILDPKNMPLSEAETSEAGKLTTMLRGVKKGFLNADYLALSKADEDAIAAQKQLAKDEIRRDLEAQVASGKLKQEDVAKEFYRRYEAAGGYVADNIANYAYSESAIERNPERRASLENFARSIGLSVDQLYSRYHANQQTVAPPALQPPPEETTSAMEKPVRPNKKIQEPKAIVEEGSTVPPIVEQPKSAKDEARELLLQKVNGRRMSSAQADAILSLPRDVVASAIESGDWQRLVTKGVGQSTAQKALELLSGSRYADYHPASEPVLGWQVAGAKTSEQREKEAHIATETVPDEPAEKKTPASISKYEDLANRIIQKQKAIEQWSEDVKRPHGADYGGKFYLEDLERELAELNKEKAAMTAEEQKRVNDLVARGESNKPDSTPPGLSSPPQGPSGPNGPGGPGGPGGPPKGPDDDKINKFFAEIAQGRYTELMQRTSDFAKQLYIKDQQSLSQLEEIPPSIQRLNVNNAIAGKYIRDINDFSKTDEFKTLSEAQQRSLLRLTTGDTSLFASAGNDFKDYSLLNSKNLLEGMTTANSKIAGTYDPQVEALEKWREKINEVAEAQKRLQEMASDTKYTEKTRKGYAEAADQLGKNLTALTEEERKLAAFTSDRQALQRQQRNFQTDQLIQQGKQLGRSGFGQRQSLAGRIIQSRDSALSGWQNYKARVDNQLFEEQNRFNQMKPEDEGYAEAAERLKKLKDASAEADERIQSLSGNFSLAGAAAAQFGNVVSNAVKRLGRQLFHKALQETKRFVKEFDASMTEIQTITMKSDEEMASVRANTISRAINLRTSVSNVASTEADLYRQGLSDTEVAARTESIIKFATVTKLKVQEATKIITTALQNDMVSSAEQAMDALVALGDSAATTAAEIGKGMQKAAASAKVAGVSYEELTALLTIGTSDTQLSGTQVGTALQTVFSRMRRLSVTGYTADQNGEKTTASDAEAALKSVGVDLWDNKAIGKMRTAYDVLLDLSKVWQNLNDAQKNIVMNSLAGTKQTNIFSTLMEGMSADNGETLEKYLGLASGSEGITQSKYEIAMQSLAASMDTLRSSWDAVVESFINGGVVTNALDGLSGFLQFISGNSGIEHGFSIIVGGIAGISAAIAALKVRNPALAAFSTILGVIAGLAAGGGLEAIFGAFKFETPEERLARESAEDMRVVSDMKEAREARISKGQSAIEEVKKLGEAYDKLQSRENEDALVVGLEKLATTFPEVSSAVQAAIQDLSNWKDAVKEAEDVGNQYVERNKKDSVSASIQHLRTYAQSEYEAAIASLISPKDREGARQDFVKFLGMFANSDISEGGYSGQKNYVKNWEINREAILNASSAQQAKILSDAYHGNERFAKVAKAYLGNVAPTVLSALEANTSFDDESFQQQVKGIMPELLDELTNRSLGEDIGAAWRYQVRANTATGAVRSLVNDDGTINYDYFNALSNAEKAHSFYDAYRGSSVLQKWVDQYDQEHAKDEGYSPIREMLASQAAYSDANEDTLAEVATTALNETRRSSYAASVRQASYAFSQGMLDQVPLDLVATDEYNQDFLRKALWESLRSELENNESTYLDENGLLNTEAVTNYINSWFQRWLSSPEAFYENVEATAPDEAFEAFINKGQENEIRFTTLDKAMQYVRDHSEYGFGSIQNANGAQAYQTSANAVEALRLQTNENKAAQNLSEFISRAASADSLTALNELYDNKGESGVLSSVLSGNAELFGSYLMAQSGQMSYKDFQQAVSKMGAGREGSRADLVSSIMTAVQSGSLSVEQLRTNATYEGVYKTFKDIVGGAADEVLNAIEDGVSDPDIKRQFTQAIVGQRIKEAMQFDQYYDEALKIVNTSLFGTDKERMTEAGSQRSEMQGYYDYIAAVERYEKGEAKEADYATIASYDNNFSETMLRNSNLSAQVRANANKSQQELINIQRTAIEELMVGAGLNLNDLGRLDEGITDEQLDKYMSVMYPGLNANDKNYQFARQAASRMSLRAYANAMTPGFDRSLAELTKNPYFVYNENGIPIPIGIAPGQEDKLTTQALTDQTNAARAEANYIPALRALYNRSQADGVFNLRYLDSDDFAKAMQDETLASMYYGGASSRYQEEYVRRLISGQTGTFLQNNGWALTNLLGEGWEQNAANLEFNPAAASKYLTGDNAEYYRNMLSQIEGGDEVLKAVSGEVGADVEAARKALVNLVLTDITAGLRDADTIRANATTLRAGTASERGALMAGYYSDVSRLSMAQEAMRGDLTDENNQEYIAALLGFDSDYVKATLNQGKAGQGTLQRQIEEKEKELTERIRSELLDGLGFDFQSTDLSGLQDEINAELNRLADSAQEVDQAVIDKLTEARDALNAGSATLSPLDAVDKYATWKKDVDNTAAINGIQNVVTEGMTFAQAQEALIGERKTFATNADFATFLSNNVPIANILQRLKASETGMTPELMNMLTQASNASLLTRDQNNQLNADKFYSLLNNNGGIDLPALDSLIDSDDVFKEWIGQFKDLNDLSSDVNGTLNGTGKSIKSLKSTINDLVIRALKPWGDQTDEILNRMKSVNRTVSEQNKLNKNWRTALKDFNNDQYSREAFRNNKKLDDEAKKYIESLGFDKKDYKNKGMREEILKAMEEDEMAGLEDLSVAFQEKFGEISSDLSAYAQNNPLIVDGVNISVNEGTISVDGQTLLDRFGEYLSEEQEAMIRQALASGMQVMYDMYSDGKGNISVVPRVTKLGGGSSSGGSGRRDSGKKGGGGGSKKSATDQLLEGQSHYIKRREHDVKMAETYSTYLQRANDYQGSLDAIDAQIIAQQRLRDQYRANIEEMQALQATVKAGSDDWYKLQESIDAAQEAMAGIDNTIKELNGSKIQITETKQTNEDQPISHASTMLNLKAQNYMDRGQFENYAVVKQNEIANMRIDMAVNNAQIEEWEDQLKIYQTGTQDWIDVRNRIWTIIEENAQLENQILEETNALNEARIAQAATDLQNSLAPFEHEQNMLGTYSGIYQNEQQFGSYRSVLTQANNNYEVQADYYRNTIQEIRKQMKGLDVGSEAWLNGRDAIYQYQEALASATATIQENTAAIEESYVTELTNKYQTSQGDIDHELKMAQLTANYYEQDKDYVNYQNMLGVQAEITARSIANTESNLAAFEARLNDGSIRAGSEAWKNLKSQILAAREQILENKNAMAELERQMQQSELEHYTEKFTKADEAIQHNLKLIQQEEQNYQMLGQLTNQNTMIGYENAELEERRALIQDYLDMLNEQLSETEDSPEVYNKIVSEIYKWEEALSSVNKQLDKNTETVKKNKEAILKSQNTVEEAVLAEIKDRIQNERDMLNSRVTLENNMIQVIRKRYQDEWALVQKDINKKKEALNKQKALINERLNAKKEAVDAEDKYERLAELQRQYSLISADVTRSKDALAIQKEMDDINKEIAMYNADKAAQAQTEALDEQIKAYDDDLATRSEQLNEYLQNANNFKEEIDLVLTGSYEDYVEWMKVNNEDYKNSLATTREQMEISWEDTWKKMRDIVDTYWDQIAKIIADPDTFVAFLEAGRKYRHAETESGQELLDVSYENMYDTWQNAILDNASWEHEHELAERIDSLKEYTYKVEPTPDFISAIGEYISNPEYMYQRDKTVSAEARAYSGYDQYSEIIGYVEGTDEMIADIRDNVEKIATQGSTVEVYIGESGSSSGGGGGGGGKTTNNDNTETTDHGYSFTSTSAGGGSYSRSDHGYSSKEAAQKAAEKDIDANMRSEINKLTGTPGTTVYDYEYNQIVERHRQMKNSIKAYASGGMVDYTGPAWVDGTKTRPESFLDAVDTENIRRLTEALNYITVPSMITPNPDMFGGNTQNVGDVNITINEAQISNDYDVQKLAHEIGNQFTKDLSKRGLNLAQYSF